MPENLSAVKLDGRLPVIVIQLTGGKFEMHAWVRFFPVLATAVSLGSSAASHAADVFQEFDYVATCEIDQPDSNRQNWDFKTLLT